MKEEEEIEWPSLSDFKAERQERESWLAIRNFRKSRGGSFLPAFAKLTLKGLGLRYGIHTAASVQMLLGCENSPPRTIIVLLYLVCAKSTAKESQAFLGRHTILGVYAVNFPSKVQYSSEILPGVWQQEKVKHIVLLCSCFLQVARFVCQMSNVESGKPFLTREEGAEKGGKTVTKYDKS